MATRSKSWSEKVATKKELKKVRLDKPFAGIPAGAMLFVATPQIVERYVERIPFGETRTIERMRRELARNNKCDATCPVSTAIFLRMVAESAWEHMQDGADVDAVAPFWRVIEPGSAIAKRLSVDPAWLKHQREIESASQKAHRSKPRADTPLRGLPNIGPIIADRLEQIGVVTVAELRAAGVAETYRRVVAAHPGKSIPVCDYLYSLQGALDGVHWNDLPAATKQRLLKQVGR